MSGTSLDGVDAVLADFAPAGGRPCELVAAAHVPFAPALRAELLALQRSGPDELARAARAANALADAYADALAEAARAAGVAAATIVAAASTARRCGTSPTTAGRCSSTIRRASPSVPA